MRYRKFLKLIKKQNQLTIAGGKGSEIKIFGNDKNGVFRIHTMGKHGKNPDYSKLKISMFLAKFGIDKDDFDK